MQAARGVRGSEASQPMNAWLYLSMDDGVFAVQNEFSRRAHRYPHGKTCVVVLNGVMSEYLLFYFEFLMKCG